MKQLRVLGLVLVFYSAGVAAYNESLSFRLNESGNTIAVIAGLVPLCAVKIEPPLDVSISGTAITITSNALDSSGGCVPPPDYVGPPYELTVDLGHLTAPVYTVAWIWQGYITPHLIVQLAPATLEIPIAIPTLAPLSVVGAGILLMIAMAGVGRVATYRT